MEAAVDMEQLLNERHEARITEAYEQIFDSEKHLATIALLYSGQLSFKFEDRQG